MRKLHGMTASDLAGQHYETYFLRVPADVSVEDLFRPQFWSNSARIRPLSRIRCVAHDESFDFELTVLRQAPGGLVVDVWPKYPASLAGRLSESATFSSAVDAAKTTLIPTRIAGKPVPRIDHTKANGWRLIGFDGNVAKDHMGSEAEAQAALNAYVAHFNLTKVGEDAAAPDKAKAKTKAA